MTVFPSPDSATEEPWNEATAPVPTSLLPCWLHAPPERVNTHAAPALPLSFGPPTMTVFPSPDSATEEPWNEATAPVPTSLLPCWLHAPPERVNTHAAPAAVLVLSPGPPTMAVFPSADSVTEEPWYTKLPTAPVPTNLAPCWLHAPFVRV